MNDPLIAPGRIYCEELAATARTDGECPNPAKFAAYMRGSGRWIPLCGVHVRYYYHIAEDVVPFAALRHGAMGEMAERQAGKRP